MRTGRHAEEFFEQEATEETEEILEHESGMRQKTGFVPPSLLSLFAPVKSSSVGPGPAFRAAVRRGAEVVAAGFAAAGRGSAAPFAEEENRRAHGDQCDPEPARSQD